MLAAVPNAVRLAHAVRNYSTVIQGYAHLLLCEIEDPAQRELITEIRSAAERAADTSIHHLRTDTPAPSPALDLIPYVRELKGSIDALAGAGVKVSIGCEIPSAVVAIESTEFDQVLLNLVANARDAMHGRGEVTIAVSARDEVHAGALASLCRISVSDTGPGIPPEFADRVFWPFFTTKRDGSGIGLAEVRRIVRAAGGYVVAESKAPGGELVVYLPLLGDKEATSPQSAGSAVDCGQSGL
jgi:signal transduction histidine kinase